MERSSFYFSRKRNQKPDKDLADMQTVRAVYDQHKGRYGARRIAAALSWNKKKAERLMKKMNLKAIVREKRKYYPPAMGEVSENLLNRNFSAEKPDEKWLTDVTEFKCDGQKLYLSPILDLYNREIRSYHLSRRPNSEMVATMLSQAVAQLGAQKPCSTAAAPTARNWQKPKSPKACRAKATAGTMRRWRAFLRC